MPAETVAHDWELEERRDESLQCRFLRGTRREEVYAPRPQYLVPAAVPNEASLLLALYAAAPRIPLALLVLGAIYKQATPALLLLGSLAGAMQLLDAGIGLYENDLGKCAGPIFIAVLQFFEHLLWPNSACQGYRESFVLRSGEQLASLRSIDVRTHCQARDRPNRRNRAV
jgi:hypothetical protein